MNNVWEIYNSGKSASSVEIIEHARFIFRQGYVRIEIFLKTDCIDFHRQPAIFGALLMAIPCVAYAYEAFICVCK